MKENFLKPLGVIEAQIVEALEPVLSLSSCELVDIQLSGMGGRPQLRLFLDRSSLDELADLTRLISDTLDVENHTKNWFKNAYQLEISSPGLDRPLTKKSHFEKAIGENIKVKAIGLSVRGTLKFVDPVKGIEVEGHEGMIGWPEIKNSNVIYNFRR
jgi:ribosome maturation factor RimP